MAADAFRQLRPGDVCPVCGGPLTIIFTSMGCRDSQCDLPPEKRAKKPAPKPWTPEFSDEEDTDPQWTDWWAKALAPRTPSGPIPYNGVLPTPQTTVPPKVSGSLISPKCPGCGSYYTQKYTLGARICSPCGKVFLAP